MTDAVNKLIELLMSYKDREDFNLAEALTIALICKEDSEVLQMMEYMEENSNLSFHEYFLYAGMMHGRDWSIYDEDSDEEDDENEYN